MKTCLNKFQCSKNNNSSSNSVHRTFRLMPAPSQQNIEAKEVSAYFENSNFSSSISSWSLYFLQRSTGSFHTNAGFMSQALRPWQSPILRISSPTRRSAFLSTVSGKSTFLIIRAYLSKRSSPLPAGMRVSKMPSRTLKKPRNLSAHTFAM